MVQAPYLWNVKRFISAGYRRQGVCDTWPALFMDCTPIRGMLESIAPFTQSAMEPPTLHSRKSRVEPNPMREIIANLMSNAD